MKQIPRAALLTTVLAVALVGALAVAPTALALTEDPTVSDDSDIDDGVTIQLVDADEETETTLEVTTDNSDEIEEAVATIEVADRGYVVYEADEDADAYELEEGVDTTDDGTNDSDVHTWTISHDEFADVPVEAGGEVDLDFEVEVHSEADEDGNVTGTITADNSMERGVYVLDDAALDGDDEAILSADEETEETGMLFWSEETTTYELEASDVATDGDNTTHYVYVDDSDARDEFDSAAEDGVIADGWFAEPEAEAGDRIFGLSVAHDGHAASTFYDEVDDDLFEDENETTATYDASESAFVVELGDDYADEESVDLEASNQQPLELVGDADEIPDAMTQDLSFTQLRSIYGVMNAFSLNDWPIIG